MQARLQPYGVGSTVSVQTMVGAAVGTDDVTFAVGRTNQVWLDGAAYTFGSSGVMTLAGGTVTETSSGTYRVNWNTGETMSVTVNGAYINDTIQLTGADAGNVQGLLGPDTGSAANDLQLANGTPLGTTITSSELYGAFASAWRITQPASLLNYAIGQTTTTFTDTSFPADVLQLDQLPASVVAEAEQLAEQAGITDPNLIQAAAIDLLVTGNPSAVFASANVQQQGVSLFGADVAGHETPVRCEGLMLSLLGTQAPSVLRQWFAKLSEGGRVVDDLQQRPWGASDGQVVDRFGLHWLIGYENDDGT